MDATTVTAIIGTALAILGGATGLGTAIYRTVLRVEKALMHLTHKTEENSSDLKEHRHATAERFKSTHVRITKAEDAANKRIDRVETKADDARERVAKLEPRPHGA
jgi:hypothetical protein